MAGGYLTTHVLDVARGRPAAGLTLMLYRLPWNELVVEAVTNADGRTDAALLPAERFQPGTYEIVFHAGDYLRGAGHEGPAFLDQVPVRFEMEEDAHYHVPLLLSPYGYSTYRGS